MPQLPAPTQTPSAAALLKEPLAKLSGLVERVTFHSEESGFCVLRIKTKGERDLITVIGHAPSVTPGEYASASGLWTTDREYGRQFKASFLKIYPPTTLSGIEKYLGSGMVKGIGPVYAGKLVRAFGESVFEVIEKSPDRLYEVRGIGPKRVARITAGWADQKVIRAIMVFLHGHGVSTSKAVRIYKTYGADAVKTVQENPYRLAQDIRGIGFKSADTIAQNLGFDKLSPLRARAGVLYVLSEVSGNLGHCCLAREALASQAAELLEIPREVIDEAIVHELDAGTLIEDRIPAEGSIYPAYLWHNECSIASLLASLMASPLPWPHIDAEKALSWAERWLGITLAKSQREALRLALRSKILVITGGPGVGKTTLVRSILEILRAKGVRIALAAPTGRAAKRLSESSGEEAKTIHRLLEIDPATFSFKRNEDNPIEADLLVVDESSMVDVQIADSLLRAVPKRAAVLFVGDADQLPSVGPGNVLADIIGSGAVPVIRLTEVFRQAAASWIIRAAHRINEGRFPELPKKGDKADFYFVPEDDAAKLPDLVVGLVKTRLPKAYGVDPVQDIQVLCPMNRSGTGARALNELLQAALNPPGNTAVTRFGNSFGPGDKVMQIQNNYDREVFNGDIGFVKKVDAVEGELTAEFDGRDVVYPFGELDELVLCYATTIHKSQGSEYPVVVIPITTQHYMMLKKNLVYTGVTRGKRLVVLVGQKRALQIAIHNKEAMKRSTGLSERIRESLPEFVDAGPELF